MDSVTSWCSSPGVPFSFPLARHLQVWRTLTVQFAVCFCVVTLRFCLSSPALAHHNISLQQPKILSLLYMPAYELFTNSSYLVNLWHAQSFDFSICAPSPFAPLLPTCVYSSPRGLHVAPEPTRADTRQRSVVFLFPRRPRLFSCVST